VAAPPATARILILTADVGDGHVAAGRALREQLAAHYDIQADVRDGLALLGPAAQHIIRDGYRRQLAVAPWAYNLSYQACRRVRPLQAAGGQLLYLAGRRRLGEFVRDHSADVVVSTHPALTAALARMRVHGELDAALCALVLDLTDNPMWCHRGADRHIVMHPVALPWVRRHIGGGSVIACHPLVSPRFVAPEDRDTVRAGLGVGPGEPLVVVSGGGWGVGALADGADAALAAGARHVVVLAGRNVRSSEDLSRRYTDEPRVRVLSFTDRMPELLGGADVLVHGTGGMTSHEALAR
jgi:UDP-N-acetylglucosamine:LPS N-acetylglucosamine transferase